MNLFKKKSAIPEPAAALPGRPTGVELPARHAVSGAPLVPPWPVGMRQALFGLGCFWGAERKFWQLPGVYSTSVGYAGGYTPNPSYEEVCSGDTGHAEVVSVIYDPDQVSYPQLLTLFWESHDPTHGMRQGNDVGTQYRSVIYCTDAEQKSLAEESRRRYQQALTARGKGAITTEIREAPPYFHAEGYHQQYLHKNPRGYCGIGGCGVEFPA